MAWLLSTYVDGVSHMFTCDAFVQCVDLCHMCHSSPFGECDALRVSSILSLHKNVPVDHGTHDLDIELNTIDEEQSQDFSSSEGNNDNSGDYQGSLGSGANTGFSMTCSGARYNLGNTESELLVTSSSPKLSENLQVWTHLYTMSNELLAIPLRPRNDTPRLWFTRFIALGSTGAVWQCCFDTGHDSFAAKIVEMLCPSDAQKRQRLRNEFEMYLRLDQAYQSKQLQGRIAPRCYGAFEGRYMDVLILDLCDSILNSWDDLSVSERFDVYKLVQDLHSTGIVHNDLQPRNIVRTHGGRFLLIDFSESEKHICRERKVGVPTHPSRSRSRSEEVL